MSKYRTINIPPDTFSKLRMAAAKADKGPGVYATEVLNNHLSEPRKKRKRSLAK